VRDWTGIAREFRVYRIDRSRAQSFQADARVQRNSLSDLLCFEPAESWQSRDDFLSAALTRLEQGESAYTVNIDSRLAHSGWMAFNQAESYMPEVDQTLKLPPGSVVLYDFYSQPKFRAQGLYRATLAHMLHTAFTKQDTQYAYMCVLADNLPSRHVIEALGFEHQGSFFWESRFGEVKKWADSIFEESQPVGA
jgi:RimJ/RimL family protein N-acetyltransferase